MPLFTSGQLNHNEIQSALFNMIISQQVEASNIKGTYSSLVDKARVDGSLYGDQKLYIDTNVLKTHAWGADSEATNLLALDRPPAPKVQSIVLKNFRQIRCTVDEYMSKRAFSEEGVFFEYNGVLLGWLRDTKRVYESRLYNTFFGTEESSTGRQMVSLPVSTARGNGSTEEEANRLEAECIAEGMANLIVDMKDTTSDFNDYGFLRSFADEEIKVVWSQKHVAKLKYVDLPTIFHKEGMIQKFEEEVLPARYFGVRITASNIASYSDSTPAPGKPIDSDDGAYTPGSNHANGCIRSLVEKDEVDVGGTKYHVFPGDEIPAGATIVASTGDFLPGEVYIETADVICKIVVKLPALMSAFEVGTSFFNPRSLTTNHYLTWGYNDLEHFMGKPFITVKAA
jgi:hypothetical protein